jgi:hypothetical protein
MGIIDPEIDVKGQHRLVSKHEVHSGDNTRAIMGAAKTGSISEWSWSQSNSSEKPARLCSQIELLVRSHFGQIRPVIFWFLGQSLKTLRAKWRPSPPT